MVDDSLLLRLKVSLTLLNAAKGAIICLDKRNIG